MGRQSLPPQHLKFVTGSTLFSYQSMGVGACRGDKADGGDDDLSHGILDEAEALLIRASCILAFRGKRHCPGGLESDARSLWTALGEAGSSARGPTLPAQTSRWPPSIWMVSPVMNSFCIKYR